jgi:signal transduction histidine kinase
MASYVKYQPRLFVTVLGLVLVLLVWVPDNLTSPDASFKAFYLIPIVLVSWFAERWAGTLVAFAGGLAGWLADAATRSPDLSLAVVYWNSLAQTSEFLLAAYLITTCSELRRREKANRLSVLAHSDELMKALLQTVSRDIWAPPASIKMSITSLLDTEVRRHLETRKALLEGIDRDCNRLNYLVSNLLDMARVELD